VDRMEAEEVLPQEEFELNGLQLKKAKKGLTPYLGTERILIIERQ
jgi:hypothetical protein